jgi:hypothetical protein
MTGQIENETLSFDVRKQGGRGLISILNLKKFIKKEVCIIRVHHLF